MPCCCLRVIFKSCVDINNACIKAGLRNSPITRTSPSVYSTRFYHTAPATPITEPPQTDEVSAL